MLNHKNNSKRTMILAGLAIVLVILAGVAFSNADTSNLEGRMRTGQEENLGGAEPADMGSWLGECNDDICDVMDAVEDLHDEVGYSTWTLSALAGQVHDSALYLRDVVWSEDSGFVTLYSDVDDLADESDLHTNYLQSIYTKVQDIYTEVNQSSSNLGQRIDAINSKVNDVHIELTNSTSDLWEALDEIQMKIDYIIANM